jgi:hypothetical protein
MPETRKGKIKSGQTLRASRFVPSIFCFPFSVFLPVVFSLFYFPFAIFSAAAQEEGEIVVNLAAGRVAVVVAKDGIAIGATQEEAEAGSRPPAVVQVSERRVGILLGAVEWLQPGTGAPAVRMDRELLKSMGAVAGPKRLQAEHADDLQELGLQMLEALRPLTSRLHRRLELGPDEPILEILLVGYLPDYGPEVWSIRYHVVQEPVRGDYWRTRIQRPRYTQLYPPEKGEPRTLIEVSYPPQAGAPLLEHAKSAPPSSDAQIARAHQSIRNGESHKAKVADALPWLRRLLDTSAPPDATQIVAVIHEHKDFEWVLAPPEPVERAADDPTRDPTAPTLRKKP